MLARWLRRTDWCKRVIRDAEGRESGNRRSLPVTMRSGRSMRSRASLRSNVANCRYLSLEEETVKLIKIRFTSWRDRSVASRSPAFQEQLDAWAKRESALSAAVAHIKEQEINANIETLQKSLARIAADVQKIDDERTLLLSAEEAAVEAEARAASKHEKAGTFGYQVFNDAGTHVTKIVDEAGNDLPAQAVFSYEVVDDHPPLPAWAKQGQTKH